jgi:hypothetical protein
VHAEFVGFEVSVAPRAWDRIDLLAYRVWARFDGPIDTALSAHALTGGPTTGFWHHDAYSGGLSQAHGKEAHGNEAHVKEAHVKEAHVKEAHVKEAHGK